MKKIEFSRLAVNNLQQDEVIEWMAGASANLVTEFQKAIAINNMGSVGLVASQLIILAGVAQALNEDVNGKKEPTVV